MKAFDSGIIVGSPDARCCVVGCAAGGYYREFGELTLYFTANGLFYLCDMKVSYPAPA
jgi:hypothetical protein